MFAMMLLPVSSVSVELPKYSRIELLAREAIIRCSIPRTQAVLGVTKGSSCEVYAAEELSKTRLVTSRHFPVSIMIWT